MLFNKKASLEISIQAIVIVVLAMTVLGLGLGFIKGMFSSITGVTSGTFDKIADQLQKDLVSSNEKLVFSQTKVAIERGKSLLLGWGIKNEGNQRLNYWAEFSAVKCPGPHPCPSVDELNSKWFIFKYKPSPGQGNSPYTVGAAENTVVRVELSVPQTSGVDTGLYLIDLSIYDGDNPDTTTNKYASTDIFITVT